MSLVIGCRDQKSGVVYVGADSACSDDSHMYSKKLGGSKLFTRKTRNGKPMIIGVAGSFAVIRVLKHEALKLPPVTCKSQEKFCEYLSRTVIPFLVKKLAVGSPDDRTFTGLPDSSVLFAYQRFLVCLQADMGLQYCDDDEPIAIGSGYQVAIGAFSALKSSGKLTTEQLIRKAITIASNNIMSVGGDVRVLHT